MQVYSVADQISDTPADVTGPNGFPMPVDPAVVDRIKGAVRVRADDPASWYYLERENVDWRFGSDTFGPVRMPFPAMWIEWVAPPQYYAEGVLGRNPISSGGVLLEEFDKAQVLEEAERNNPNDAREIRDRLLWASRVIWYTVFIRYRSDGRIIELGRGFYGTDESGNYKGSLSVRDDRAFEGLHSMVDGSIIPENARPAILSLGLINCRNVRIEPERREPTTRKQRKRNKVPHLSFHTIKLPVSSSATRAEKKAATTGVMPLHMVRGHFKTYTADSPLLGRAVGTYWWGSQARGRKSNGIVKADYEVTRNI